MPPPKKSLFVIKSLSNQIKRCMVAGDHQQNLHQMTGMQHAVIGYLGDRLGEDVFQRDIEADFNVRRSTATGILQLMEKNGLIRKEAVDYDARLKKLILTEKGMKVRHFAIIRMEELEERMTRDITGQELEAFFQTAEKMLQNLREAEEPLSSPTTQQANNIRRK